MINNNNNILSTFLGIPSNFSTKTITLPRCNHNHVNLSTYYITIPPLPDRIRLQVQNLRATRHPASAFRPSSTTIDQDPFVSAAALPANDLPGAREDGAFPPTSFIFNPTTSSPPTSPVACQEKRPANGLNAAVFNPRNHSRSILDSRPLPADSSDYLRAGTRTYAAVQATTRPRSYVRTAPNHLVKTCK